MRCTTGKGVPTDLVHTLSPPGALESFSAHLEEEDVGSLHAGVKDLGRGQLLALLAPHDGAASGDARHGEAACDVHHAQPVLVGARVDLVAGPQELHIRHVHAGSTPHLQRK